MWAVSSLDRSSPSLPEDLLKKLIDTFSLPSNPRVMKCKSLGTEGAVWAPAHVPRLLFSPRLLPVTVLCPTSDLPGLCPPATTRCFSGVLSPSGELR